MKKFKKIGSNEVEGATTTNKDWGFKPVPNKGGKTTNVVIFSEEEKKNA
jgi:hypothetical protein